MKIKYSSSNDPGRGVSQMPFKLVIVSLIALTLSAGCSPELISTEYVNKPIATAHYTSETLGSVVEYVAPRGYHVVQFQGTMGRRGRRHREERERLEKEQRENERNSGPTTSTVENQLRLLEEELSGTRPRR